MSSYHFSGMAPILRESRRLVRMAEGQSVPLKLTKRLADVRRDFDGEIILGRDLLEVEV